ncbi:IMPACT family protein [Undibacterium sp. Xuan67W]|uniref:IMPACT family protein n=1 Tax=Undibacterium sp. Xuan67W TaxID=3413057 RepID=UPI003BF1F261
MYQLVSLATAEIEIKKSRFLGQLYPVTTRAEARSLLLNIRTAHPNAVHVCWALICDGDSGLDDDGEPSGTAARPIYNVLVHKQLHNILAVVIRYWGGTKLGAGGLTRAYGQAISDAFKTAELQQVESYCERIFHLQFADESSLRRLCEQHQISIVSADYADTVELRLKLKQQQVQVFEQLASDLLRGSLQIRDPDIC